MWSGSSEGQCTDGHWKSLKATVTHHPLLLFLGCHGFWGMSLGKLKHIFGNNSLPGSNSLPLSLSISVCLCVSASVCVCVCVRVSALQPGRKSKYVKACNLQVFSRFDTSDRAQPRLFLLFVPPQASPVDPDVHEERVHDQHLIQPCN